MTSERGNSDDVSATSKSSVVDEGVPSRIETLYMAVMCFVAACLSSMSLDVASRSPLGHSVTKSSTFNAIFRRNYSMKIKIYATNIILGLITTSVLGIGDYYGNPYLYVPWLINTMSGLAFFQGPAILRLSYGWLPITGFSAGIFIFLTYLLYLEEICLWLDVFTGFKSCWLEYTQKNIEIAAEQENIKRLSNLFFERVNINEERTTAKAGLEDKITESITSTAPKSISSDSALCIKSTNSSDDIHARNENLGISA